jgi:branched-chain amino acid aminotransferase
LAEEMGIKVDQTRIPRELLYISDEVFFTGTAAEITPIRSVDHKPVADGQPGPMTKRLQAAYFDILLGRVEDRHGWLTHI